LPGKTIEPEGEDTTHFSIIDADGNRVLMATGLPRH
jgi:gamma-glutamyltranspeptidase